MMHARWALCAPIVVAACTGVGYSEIGSPAQNEKALGLLAPLAYHLAGGEVPTCRATDGRVGQPFEKRTRDCRYARVPGLIVWAPAEGMGQPRLSYRVGSLRDTAAAAAHRDSLLQTMRRDGVVPSLRPCSIAPPRRFFRGTTVAEALGADLTFLVLEEGDGSYSLRMFADPTGARARRDCPSPAASR